MAAPSFTFRCHLMASAIWMSSNGSGSFLFSTRSVNPNRSVPDFILFAKDTGFAKRAETEDPHRSRVKGKVSGTSGFALPQCQSQIAPPRLGGWSGNKGKKADAYQMLILTWLTHPCLQQVGVFSTRSPHRPNPIGLSVAKVVGVDSKKGIIELSSVSSVHCTSCIIIFTCKGPGGFDTRHPDIGCEAIPSMGRCATDSSDTELDPRSCSSH